MYMLCIW